MTRKSFQVPFEYKPYYRANGFTHPNLYIIKMDEPENIYSALWGLIPEFAMADIPGVQKKYNTLNAKSEAILTSNTY
ncbi:hypothetical protein [Zobellia uliginosa]|uniref:hypothetical protein n=1 Tax=Zobellia uliginosa TaxID=143224 RepID=UPI001C06DF23|nr:hypothetical protein [Zobellia uliginosa]MBU2947357.1 hypothetical protein [Zobellia uliginosa]